jgi:hypothetical protein
MIAKSLMARYSLVKNTLLVVDRPLALRGQFFVSVPIADYSPSSRKVAGSVRKSHRSV